MYNKNKAFPFPDRSLALEELKRDPVYNKIPVSKVDELVDLAWQIGVSASKDISENFDTPYDFREITQINNLEVIDVDVDRVIGNQRFFSEYITKQSKIFMYQKSIEKWGEINDLSYEAAYNLILAHEYFHFLEYTKYGYTSKRFLVPMIQIGKVSIGKTGIRALSEIGAHAFVNELFLKGN